MFKIQLVPVQISDEYRREWNAASRDFVHLYKDGELVNNTLYRVGGFGGDVKKDYFMLLKYIESIYDMEFITRCYPEKSNKELQRLRKHLEGRWCIIDKNGVEKVEFDQFQSPFIKEDSCIYSLDQNYYNIETGEFYCHTYNCVTSAEYLFLENQHDKNVSRRGVMKIHKKDGSYELFPLK